jgi:ATP-dependent Clp protease ATP-binding subunit ClpC
MILTDVKKQARDAYYPIYLLEDIVSYGTRKKVKLFFGIMTILGFVASGIVYFFGSYIPQEILSYGTVSYLVASIAFIVWLILALLNAFYFSYIHKNKEEAYMPFDVGYAIYKLSVQDITASLLTSPMGSYIALRCGITSEMISNFLRRRKKIITDDMCQFPDSVSGWNDVVLALYDTDKELAQLFFGVGINRPDLVMIIEWIVEREGAQMEREWWWSRDNLSRIPSIGQGWSYGETYHLDMYHKELPPVLSSRYEVHSSYGVSELKELQTILSRTRGANALLLSDDEAGKLYVVSHLAQMITEGMVSPELKHKLVRVLDTNKLISEHQEKIAFENTVVTILSEAVSAGNIVLVIDNLWGLISAGNKLGLDMVSVLEPFIISYHLQCVALSTLENFHEFIEKNPLLMQSFEKVFIKDIGVTNTVKVLENEIIQCEDAQLFFTYQSLTAIAQSAERYFSDGMVADKAVDLLLEIVPQLKAKGKVIVEKTDVMELITLKTGIPVGAVGGAERDKLLNLETILHERIVGQEEAIKSISDTVRRSRSGIVNPQRPIGSFLFLGPTGVGKTETTKALNEVFFGSEGEILRLDMSEYSGADALSKLIGSFETKTAGVLSSMLREHQYGVLLLDEFEKTTPEVMNLFLQVLDEGFFSDNDGKKINARNLIIIATSNAGSDVIWSTLQSGGQIATAKASIIDSIIASGTFKPELVNRFDGVVVFEPLSSEDVKKIARLMLAKLQKRLAETGVKLIVDDMLVDYISGYGLDPKFGARPLQRAIQERVEQVIAKKIIAGTLGSGQEIQLTESDLT